MKRIITIVAIALVCVTVVTFAYYGQKKPSLRELPQQAALSSRAAAEISATEAGAIEYTQASANTKGAAEVHPPAKTIANNLKVATDWFAFAKSILLRAQAGDPAAQFALWQVHQVCYESTATVMGRALTWDDAIQKAASLHIPMSDAKKDYDQCHGFFSEDASALGDPWQWLQRATDQGYPAAQIATAQARLQQDELKAFQQHGAVPAGYGLLPPIGGPDVKPSELVVAAIKSLDPEAIADAAVMMNIFHPGASVADRELTFAAWTYVGCIRGADCSAFGEPDKSFCAAVDANCVGVPSQLLDMTHNNWDALQARVNEINAALDAKDWAKLGLGS